MTEDDVRTLLLKRAKRFAKSKGTTGVTNWSVAHGINQGHVSDFVRGTKTVPAKVLEALGLEIRYMRARRNAASDFPVDASSSDVG